LQPIHPASVCGSKPRALMEYAGRCPDHSGGLLKSRARARLDRPRSDLWRHHARKRL